MWYVINCGIFGAVIIDDLKDDVYYIGKFTSDPDILQEDFIIDGKNIVMSGELVNDY